MLDRLVRGIGALAGPEILEVRVHGVQNTPPAEMLETTPENIERHRGDELGSFWRRTDDRPAHGIQSVEAYSWGAQARTGGGALAAIGRVFVQLGWFLLLPFALANLAYWTRHIGPQRDASAKYWDGDSGAASVRIFALLLTLLSVAAFSSVAIDLVAVQCFRGGTEVCASLPAALDGLRDLDRDSRAALFGILPIAAIIVLYAIGRRGRVHYDERVRKFSDTMQEPGTTEEGVPLLSTGGFWSQARIGPTTEWLHVAASVAMVLFLLALDAAYVEDATGCWRTDPAGDPLDTAQQCIDLAVAEPIPFWFGLGALVLFVAIVLLVWRASHTRNDAKTNLKRGLSMTCLAVAIVGYVAWTILAFTTAPPQPANGPGFLGLIVTPLILVAGAFVLALAGVGWKSRQPSAPGKRSPDWWRRPLSAILLAAAALSLLFSHVLVAEENRWWLFAAAAALIVVHLMVAWSMPVSHAHEGWRGQGAAVAMILALFASMALSSLLVLGTAFWLNTPAEAGEVVEIWRTPAEVPADRQLDVPDAYERFAVVLTVIVVLVLFLVLAVLIWNLIRLVALTLPSLRRPDDDEGDAIELGGVDAPGAGAYPTYLKNLEGRLRRRVTVRRSSHLLHRGEALFGWLTVFATIGFLSLSSAVVFDTVRAILDDVAPGSATGIRIASNAVLAAVAVAAVAAVATHAGSSSERPLGVFWDVVAFFPRAGHPFAPPCFGERVVPELSARTKAWLGDPAALRPRAVIYTAHSMGSTICTATILALRDEKVAGTAITPRLAMLSYGTQLRAYFSRFFPSVFGPSTLGVPGLRGPSLWTRDPWARQVGVEFANDYAPRPGADPKTSLTGILGSDGTNVPRWKSLWRRTDYLGFPVYSYRGGPGNPIDLGATESAPASYLWRIATHSDYLGTPQFEEARNDLVTGLGGRPG